VRDIQIRPAWFACVASALISRGAGGLVVQSDTGSCSAVGQNSGRSAPADVDPGTFPLAGAAALRVADLG
jgi:hypothetical protein